MGELNREPIDAHVFDSLLETCTEDNAESVQLSSFILTILKGIESVKGKSKEVQQDIEKIEA